MITEEALPTYMAMLNTLDGVRDETGASPTPWGKWTREWTAEENRHGDVMNKYMYLTGRWVAGHGAGLWCGRGVLLGGWVDGSALQAGTATCLAKGRCWYGAGYVTWPVAHPACLFGLPCRCFTSIICQLDAMRPTDHPLLRAAHLPDATTFTHARVNMHAIEVTIQNLIGSGMDPKTENNPYLGFTYTSFQERATKVSHGNTARHALEHGDEVLAKICGMIASDEGRHEQAYCRVSAALWQCGWGVWCLAVGGVCHGDPVQGGLSVWLVL
jgi:hypothetical protein